MELGTDPPERIGYVTLPDGRALAWSEWGTPGGTPVLLCPGAATGRSLGFGVHLLTGLGARLVSVDRPGLGASDPAPGRTLADFAEDVRALAGPLRLGRPAVVGNSQGAPFALACAAAGAARSLALVSAADEVARPEFAAALPPGPRALADLVAADPEAAERNLCGFGPESMWDLVNASSPEPDLAVYRTPGFEAAYRRALAEGFARGGAGYARDTVLATARWNLDLALISVPVDVWYGELDTFHSPDRGALLTSRVPGARRHLVPDAGGSLLWTHAGDVLRALLAHR
ncbi:alpha/beta fold hydrolase [Nocardiopsis deserti]|uniref:alpha/beta fold hydrolase n=1 Tax=Nocardiopsis deserti TaxID=2605988 RepID=UPI0012397094|nr:alpha/beta hydrolase [Nocardiopsis deserti]